MPAQELAGSWSRSKALCRARTASSMYFSSMTTLVLISLVVIIWMLIPSKQADHRDGELDEGTSHPQRNAESRDAEGGDDGERSHAAQDRPPRPDLAAAVRAEDDREKEDAVGGSVGGGRSADTPHRSPTPSWAAAISARGFEPMG